MTFPSLLNMLTSSIAWMGWTLSFLRAVCSFLSSVPELLWTFLTFLRGVPLPLYRQLVTTCAHYCTPLSIPMANPMKTRCCMFVGWVMVDGGVVEAGGILLTLFTHALAH
jgi:hypothetical protein